MNDPKIPALRQTQQVAATRRSFLASGTGLLSAAMIAAHWPSMVQAAEHAGHVDAVASVHDGADASSASTTVLNAAEVADVEAIANQIVPGGATPGAREARVVHFIDRALGTFLAAQLPAFRAGLAQFQQEFAAHDSAGKAFAQVSDARQMDWLHEVEGTAFFQLVRQLTVLGLVASPKYGGNHDKKGWQLLGFDDRHVWQPPFGHYDADYKGFEPYPGTKPWTADIKATS